MENERSNGRKLIARGGRFAAALMVVPSVAGGVAAAQDQSAQVTAQQQAVMKHLEELYQRDGREMPSLRIEDAPNAYVPRGMTVRPVTEAEAHHAEGTSQSVSPVGAEDNSRDGLFSWFRPDRSGGETKRPSLWDRMRGRDERSATDPDPSRQRPGLFGRMMTPFRSDEARENESARPEADPDRIAREEPRPRSRDPFSASQSATMPPPAPAPSRPPAHRTARRDGGIDYRERDLLLERVKPDRGEAGPSEPVPFPEDESFEMLPAPREGTSEAVSDRSMFEEIEGAPASAGGPPPAPPAKVPAPRESPSGPMVPPPIGETPSSNGNATDPVSSRSGSSTENDRRENARYVEVTRKLAERRGLVGMQGFCPVALRDQHELVDARPEFLCVHRGQTYAVSSARAKARFDADPERYAPVARGIDLVLASRGRGRVEGTLTHSVWYQGRLYLFAKSESAKEFRRAPAKYAARGR